MMKESLIDIEPKHLVILKKIFKLYIPSKTVWAYGSRVTWTANTKSDLDIIVFDVNSKQINNLKDALAESDLPFSVDVMNWEKIPETFKENIQKKYVVLQDKADLEDWKECKLGEVVVLSYGKALKEELRIPGKIPVFSSAGITGWHNHPLVNSPGIIIGRKGTVGKVYKSRNPFYCIDTAYYILPNNEKYNFDFLYYLLQTLGLEELNSDSAVPGLNRNAAYAQQFLLPPLPEQRAIASVLSSLDDKIDLLHRQNETLEAMAEALFRQWFKPPDPLKGEEEGWEEKPLSSIANFLNGLACQKYPPKNEIEKLPVLKIRELRNGLSEDSDWATSNIGKEYIVEQGDIIFSWSASLMVKIWDGEKCILNQHLFKVTSENYPKWFYLYWCKYHLDEFIAISESHATTMGHIKRKDLDNAIVLIPTDKELNVMTEIMEPIIDKKTSNHNQIRTLEKLRDTLLPKLMSGEVRVVV